MCVCVCVRVCVCVCVCVITVVYCVCVCVCVCVIVSLGASLATLHPHWHVNSILDTSHPRHGLTGSLTSHTTASLARLVLRRVCVFV